MEKQLSRELMVEFNELLDDFNQIRFNDFLQKLETMPPDVRQEFIEKLWKLFDLNHTAKLYGSVMTAHGRGLHREQGEEMFNAIIAKKHMADHKKNLRNWQRNLVIGDIGRRLTSCLGML